MESDPKNGTITFSSGWIELFVPFTPFAQTEGLSEPRRQARFVGLDDINNVFYDIDYDNPYFKNQVPWRELALHAVKSPAIVFPPGQLALFDKNPCTAPSGFLVSIQSKSQEAFEAKFLGQATLKRLPMEFMNWEAIRSSKHPELEAEIKAGLLRQAYNHDPGTAASTMRRKIPGKVANQMVRHWEKDPAALNYELDGQFTGVVFNMKPQKWIIKANTA